MSVIGPVQSRYREAVHVLIVVDTYSSWISGLADLNRGDLSDWF